MHYGKIVLLQNNVTVPSNGIETIINSNDKATIFISGTSTSRTIIFEGKDNDGNWYSASAIKLSDATRANQTTGNNEAWSLDLSNWVSFRIRVSAVAGGYVRVTAKIIRTNG